MNTVGLKSLLSIGFSRHDCESALKSSIGNERKALTLLLEWLIADLESPSPVTSSSADDESGEISNFLKIKKKILKQILFYFILLFIYLFTLLIFHRF